EVKRRVGTSLIEILHILTHDLDRQSLLAGGFLEEHQCRYRLPMDVLRLENGVNLLGEPFHVFDAPLAEIEQSEIFDRYHRCVVADSLHDKSVPNLQKDPFGLIALA